MSSGIDKLNKIVESIENIEYILQNEEIKVTTDF